MRSRLVRLLARVISPVLLKRDTNVDWIMAIRVTAMCRYGRGIRGMPRANTKDQQEPASTQFGNHVLAKWRLCGYLGWWRSQGKTSANTAAGADNRSIS